MRSINTFLDEFLWNILSTARSLVTDRIKAAVLKILPTSLGKAALLEAEVELKAYWERTNPTSNPAAGASDTLDFPLQWSYEVFLCFLRFAELFWLTGCLLPSLDSFYGSNAKHTPLSTIPTKISLLNRD